MGMHVHCEDSHWQSRSALGAPVWHTTTGKTDLEQTCRDRILSRVHQWLLLALCAPTQKCSLRMRLHNLSMQEECILWEIRVVIPLQERHTKTEELHEPHLMFQE